MYIIELKVWGVIKSVLFNDDGLQYGVRYFYNGEAHTVYFYFEELSNKKL